jgi:hypothetical protein
LPRIAGVDEREALVRSGIRRLRCIMKRIADVVRGCPTVKFPFVLHIHIVTRLFRSIRGTRDYSLHFNLI